MLITCEPLEKVADGKSITWFEAGAILPDQLKVLGMPSIV